MQNISLSALQKKTLTHYQDCSSEAPVALPPTASRRRGNFMPIRPKAGQEGGPSSGNALLATFLFSMLLSQHRRFHSTERGAGCDCGCRHSAHCPCVGPLWTWGPICYIEALRPGLFPTPSSGLILRSRLAGFIL